MNIDKIMESISRWVPQHIYGAILVLMLGLAFGFFLGFGCLVFLGSQVSVEDIPVFQAEIERSLKMPINMSDKYYYIVTPQDNQPFFVKCDNGSPARAIGGFVQITHERRIIHPTISFKDGLRTSCLSSGDKTKDLKLSRTINWIVPWASIDKGLLNVHVKVDGDGIEGIFQTEVLHLDQNKKFSAVYYYMKDNKSMEIAHIHFGKCVPDNCREILEYEMNKI